MANKVRNNSAVKINVIKTDVSRVKIMVIIC